MSFLFTISPNITLVLWTDKPNNLLAITVVIYSFLFKYPKILSLVLSLVYRSFHLTFEFSMAVSMVVLTPLCIKA